jgi:hypothetical protein
VTNTSDYEDTSDERWEANDWFYHSGFNPGAAEANLVNDIAVVFLGGTSRFTPVNVDRGGRGAADVGHASVAYGFGTTWPALPYSSTDYAPTSTVLRRVKLAVIDGGWCDDRQYFQGPLQLCAGELGGGSDTCQGDSGGPLLALRAGGTGWDTGPQIALVSYGYGCAQPYAPGIYTRLSAYIPWIAKAIPDFPASYAGDAALPAMQPAAGAVVCGAEAFGQTVWLDCGALPIGRIVSATWGRTGRGVCAPPADAAATAAPAAASTAKLAACCVGARSCAATASEGQFGAVPSGSLSSLKASGYLSMYVQAICDVPSSWGSAPPPPPPPPWPSPPPRVHAATPSPPAARSPVASEPDACAVGAPSAAPPPPPPRSPPPPPPLAGAVAAQLTLEGLTASSSGGIPAFNATHASALTAALSSLIYAGTSADDVAITLVVSDYAVAASIIVRGLAPATWAANANRYAAVFGAALAKDAAVERWQVAVLGAGEPAGAAAAAAASGRRRNTRRMLNAENEKAHRSGGGGGRSLATVSSTQVDVQLSGFGAAAAAAARASTAVTSTAATTGATFTRAAMRRFGSATATLNALILRPTTAVTVDIGLGVRAGAATTGAEVAAILSQALAAGALRADLISAFVPITNVTLGGPSNASSAIAVLPGDGTGGGAGSSGGSGAAGSSLNDTSVIIIACVAGGVLLLVCCAACVFLRAASRRRAARAEAEAVAAGQVVMNPLGVPMGVTPGRQPSRGASAKRSVRGGFGGRGEPSVAHPSAPPAEAYSDDDDDDDEGGAAAAAPSAAPFAAPSPSRSGRAGELASFSAAQRAANPSPPPPQLPPPLGLPNAAAANSSPRKSGGRGARSSVAGTSSEPAPSPRAGGTPKKAARTSASSKSALGAGARSVQRSSGAGSSAAAAAAAVAQAQAQAQAAFPPPPAASDEAL